MAQNFCCEIEFKIRPASVWCIAVIHFSWLNPYSHFKVVNVHIHFQAAEFLCTWNRLLVFIQIIRTVWSRQNSGDTLDTRSSPTVYCVCPMSQWKIIRKLKGYLFSLQHWTQDNPFPPIVSPCSNPKAMGYWTPAAVFTISFILFGLIK